MRHAYLMVVCAYSYSTVSSDHHNVHFISGGNIHRQSNELQHFSMATFHRWADNSLWNQTQLYIPLLSMRLLCSKICQLCYSTLLNNTPDYALNMGPLCPRISRPDKHVQTINGRTLWLKTIFTTHHTYSWWLKQGTARNTQWLLREIFHTLTWCSSFRIGSRGAPVSALIATWRWGVINLAFSSYVRGDGAFSTSSIEQAVLVKLRWRNRRMPIPFTHTCVMDVPTSSISP